MNSHPSEPRVQIPGIGIGDASEFVNHPTFGLSRYTVHEMPRGADGQVATTLSFMDRKVAEDAKDPEFKARAVRKFWNEDPLVTIQNVWQEAKTGIRFQRDEVTGEGVGGFGQDSIIEVIVRPVDMARYIDSGVATGDCDDFSMYVAANLSALGINVSFVTVAADGRDPNQYSHVYVAAYPFGISGERIPLDASHGTYCGWEVRGLGRIREWPAGVGGFRSVAGFLMAVTGIWLAINWGGK